MIDTWHAVPIIKTAIKHYANIRIVAYPGLKSVRISYKGIEYTLTDNGGEICVYRGDERAHFVEFPTVGFGGSLTAETIMYRLFQTLNNRPIDYRYAETEFHYLLMAA